MLSQSKCLAMIPTLILNSSKPPSDSLSCVFHFYMSHGIYRINTFVCFISDLNYFLDDTHPNMLYTSHTVNVHM